jgi:diacylglycerol kinase (ATP)
MLPLVITNPSSASGATGKAWPKIASELRTHLGPYQLSFTKKRGDAMAIALEAASKGTQLLIACGGDGTVSEVANGIITSGRAVELAILPSGTGGDFRRSLDIPTRARDAAALIREGKSRLIDVGRITYVSHSGHQSTRHFLGVASFGMSAEVIERVKREQISFARSMIQTAMSSSSARVIVQLDDEHERHLTVANFCVANARYFGGGMKIAPDAKLNDGKFDVVSIGDLSALTIVTNAPRLYTGSHLSMDNVGHVLAKKIIARPAQKGAEISLEIDGELPGRLPATFQIVPNALRVRCR